LPLVILTNFGNRSRSIHWWSVSFRAWISDRLICSTAWWSESRSLADRSACSTCERSFSEKEKKHYFFRTVVIMPGIIVSNSVLKKIQYRGRYNTGISRMLNNGIGRYWVFFTKYTLIPNKKVGSLVSILQ
jgi:hypothetical protein